MFLNRSGRDNKKLISFNFLYSTLSRYAALQPDSVSGSNRSLILIKILIMSIVSPMSFTLWSLKPLQAACIQTLRPVLTPEYRRRLEDFGFAPGKEIRCLQWTPLSGPRVYQVGDSVFSLDRELADAIELSPTA